MGGRCAKRHFDFDDFVRRSEQARLGYMTSSSRFLRDGNWQRARGFKINNGYSVHFRVILMYEYSTQSL